MRPVPLPDAEKAGGILSSRTSGVNGSQPVDFTTPVHMRRRDPGGVRETSNRIPRRTEKIYASRRTESLTEAATSWCNLMET